MAYDNGNDVIERFTNTKPLINKDKNGEISYQ